MTREWWELALTVLNGLIALWTFQIKRRLTLLEEKQRTLEVAERQARSELSMNLCIRTSIHTIADELVLQTEVEVQNVSSRTWCIPALYVAGRALPSTLDHPIATPDF